MGYFSLKAAIITLSHLDIIPNLTDILLILLNFMRKLEGLFLKLSLGGQNRAEETSKGLRNSGTHWWFVG